MNKIKDINSGRHFKVSPLGGDLEGADKDRIIEMAWEDRTTFDAIEIQFGLKQQDVIKLMRKS